jgi:hypothetical protein
VLSDLSRVDSTKIGPDDGPELTDEMLAGAEIWRGGSFVRRGKFKPIE